MGNTVIVVEHDEAMMRAADFIADMGPGAGEHGGWVVATGTIDEVMDVPASVTGQYLSGRKKGAHAGKPPNGQRPALKGQGRQGEQSTKHRR